MDHALDCFVKVLRHQPSKENNDVANDDVMIDIVQSHLKLISEWVCNRANCFYEASEISGGSKSAKRQLIESD